MTAKIRNIASWLVLGLYWPTLFLLTHLPAKKLPSIEIMGRDSTLHLIAYFILGLLFWLARYGTSLPQKRPWGILWTMVAIAAYGALDEVSQMFVNRTCSLSDWLCDVAGAGLAIFLLNVLRRPIYWLVLFWLGLFLFTHWPSANNPFLKLPPPLDVLEYVMTFVGYIGLTLLFWRTAGRADRFVCNGRLLGQTVCIVGGYIWLDELINLLIGREFYVIDIILGWLGCGVGIAASWALARHHTTNNEAIESAPKATHPMN